MQSKLSDKCCERQPHIPSTTFICPNIKALDIYQQIVSNMSQNPHLHLQPKIDSLSPALLHGLRNANI